MPCEICGSEDNLILHHTSYKPKEIQILCQSCHVSIHGETHGVGRPANPEIGKKIKELRDKKFTGKQIVSELKISNKTYYEWTIKLGINKKYKNHSPQEKRLKIVSTGLTEKIYNYMIKMIKKSGYLNEHEFIRCAIDEKIRREAPQLLEEMMKEE